ncbi:DSD1 family PLP-dependent enzyme [Zwartia panacis]|jgi:D-serine deaminase-like pyridoxal phosphate-dependent protein|uniref:DSD1 family PLP-dependent enzyme n=1 Tax=Zwartia panacis TaxID=2683345 RepID=UPI0025B4A098|nr:DSD1 family PLP-dependent enzyme [Zwartia panacis]MDN4018370.1 DSD1 family PLP-dependent enzyme [Zwartia panacis]
MKISDLSTPAALVDLAKMERNITRMQSRMDSLGVNFRPHVKTSKCVEVTQAQIKAGARGITVSTLKEAEQFFAAGITDILYAVGITANKLPQALALMRKGCDLKVLTDSVQSAAAIAAFGLANDIRFKVMIEIDTDDHRSGIKPESAQLLEVAQALSVGGTELYGVMTHAGSSYDLNTPEALAEMAEQERSGCVLAAQRLRDAGFACQVVSVGSTPTALSARQLEGVTEVRAGVYVFFDLVMHNVGVCTTDDIALSVLTTVIGHQEEKGWAIVDAGWMAMSRDRGTQKQTTDFGYGQVCTLDGEPVEGYVMTGANQEHGIISRPDHPDLSIAKRFPVGTQLRILPNHACATGAQFPEYQALNRHQTVQTWPRFYGW